MVKELLSQNKINKFKITNKIMLLEMKKGKHTIQTSIKKETLK
jgi:hypothetical protein